MKQKSALFFIHGYAVGSWYFDSFAAYFKQLGYTCYAPNLPLHDVHPFKKIEQQAVDLYHRTVYESGQVMYEILTHQQAPIDADNIQGKVLAIAGSQDRGCTPQIVQKIAKKYAEKATYKEFVGRGHEIVVEQGWEEVAAYIHDWVQRNVTEVVVPNQPKEAA